MPTASAPYSVALQWARQAAPTQQLSSPALFGYLLDLDNDLADELEVRMRFTARHQAVARLLDAELGQCELAPWFAVIGNGPGLLIVDGLLAVDTCLAGRTSSELVGSGDLLQRAGSHQDEMVSCETAWRALLPTRLALLDSAFAHRIHAWPQIQAALFRRVEQRAAELDVLRAISCQPRLEIRLVLLLWHLASRWGKVEPSGLRLHLPLTHRLIGQLVAAERPSVTHALQRLAAAEIVTGTAGDWHLHGSVDEHMQSLTAHVLAPVAHRSAAPRQ